MKASKLLSILLIVAMCFGIMATSASAAGPIVVVGGGSATVTTPDTDTTTPPAEENGDEDAVVVVEGTEEGAPEVSLFALPPVYKTDTVAVIGTVEYTTLPGAIDAAKAGETVKLVKDVSLQGTLHITVKITINLNGHTLTLTPTANADSAVSAAAAGAAIRGGSIVINTATGGTTTKPVTFIYSKGINATAALSLVDVDLTYSPVATGTELSDNITVIGGEFSQNPTAFLAEGYETAVDAEGRYPVTEKTDATFYVAQIGSNKYVTLAAALAVGGDIVLLKDSAAGIESTAVTKNFTLDLAGFSIPSAIIPAGITAVIENGKIAPATGLAVSNSGTLTLTDVDVSAGNEENYAVESVGTLTLAGGTVVREGKTGSIMLNKSGADSVLNVSDATVVAGNIYAGTSSDSAKKIIVNISAGRFGTLSSETAVADLVGNVTGGSFYAKVPAAFVAEGYQATDAQSDGTFTVSKIVATGKVTNKDGTVEYNADDSTNGNYVQHFKGTAEADNNTALVFKTTPALKSLAIGSTGLTAGTDYTLSADGTLVTIAKDAAFLNTIPAGWNRLNFTLENYAEVGVRLFILPSVTFDRTRFVKGTSTGITAKLSDAPDSISIGTSQDTLTHTTLTAANYTTNSDGSITIKPAYLDTLATGTQYIGFWYDGGAMMYKITIAPAPSITPLDANKDGKWGYGDSTLGYTVVPDVTAVSVDGTAVKASNYTVSDKGVLTLKAALLKSLNYGTHTLSVTTSDGTVGTEFTTGPSLTAKGGVNTHTKGSTKDLVFIASDAMTEVYVGSTKLTSDKYTISTDGLTITLKAAFLNTLKVDTTYTITTKGTAGAPATTFKILSTSTAATNPKTGDSSSIGLWAAVLVLSGAAVVALLPKKKKQ